MRGVIVATTASLLLGMLPLSANAADFVVDADLNSISRSPAGSGIPFVSALLDTGIDVNAGDLLTVSAVGLWRISPSDTFTDADGEEGRILHSGTTWFSSSLLVQISDTPRQVGDPEYRERTFQAGTNFSGAAFRSGRLFLGFNDADYGNNEGNVTASIVVTAVTPEPCTLALLGIGLVLLRRRR